MPDRPVRFRIPRHGVRSGPDGLSPFQVRILTDPAPIRLFSAPTGSGKSYAFQVSVKRGGAVLQVVPTRRLANALASEMVRDLIRSGLTEAQAGARVHRWTSDGRAALLEADPEADVNLERVRQVRAEGGGFIIYATPESLAAYLLRPRPYAGADVQGLFDLLRLDHLVFDEFHTITARGMGVACAVATFLARGASPTRITFLSATPIAIRPVLTAFGVPEGLISVAAEEVITGGPGPDGPDRALHGDVDVTIRTDPSFTEAVRADLPRIREVLARPAGSPGSQVLMILDSMAELHLRKNELDRLFTELGVPAAARLAINSADDSWDRDDRGPFVTGREEDPLAYRVLLATSSVELGTSYQVGHLITNPGHGPASLAQRIGRAVRGDLPGTVTVTMTPETEGRCGWVRQLIRDLDGLDEVTIDRLTGLLLAGARDRFEPGPDPVDAEPGTFHRLPQAAAWAAGLFWVALERSALTPGHRDTLRRFAPPIARRVGGLMRRLETSPVRAAQGWHREFLDEAIRVREIPQAVVLVGTDGVRKNLSPRTYLADSRLTRCPVREDERGRLEVLLDMPVDRALQGLSRDRPVRIEVDVPLPHRARRIPLPEEGLERAYPRLLEREMRDPGVLDEELDALEAARELVRLTRIVPA
jgi:hypothetical protein